MHAYSYMYIAIAKTVTMLMDYQLVNTYMYVYIGVLKSSGDKVTFKFHTSTDKEPKVYTICTVGEIDTVLSLLG